MVKKDKGKARAAETSSSGPTESSPLLGTANRSSPPLGNNNKDDRLSRRVRGVNTTRTSILYIALIIALSLLAAAVLFLALLLNSFRPSNAELDALQDKAFQYAGPDGVSVVNVTDDGVLVNVSLRAGIDWARSAGVQRWADEREKEAAIERGWRGTGAEWWEDLRRWTAGKMMAHLDRKTVRVDIPEQVLIFPDHFTSFPLFSVAIPNDIEIPLVADVSAGTKDHWLKPVHVLALAKPIASTGDLMAFAQKAWELGEVRVVIGVTKVQVNLPLSGWLARFASVEKGDITRQLHMPVPKLPGLPWPGKPLNLSSLVHLDSYTFQSRDDRLQISAAASVPNVLPRLNTSVPFNLPFSIHLPNDQKMADVITAPLELNSWAPRIGIHISGVVVADLSGETRHLKHNASDSALSLFLQKYLHGLDNAISVRGLSALPTFARPELSPPNWLLATLPSLSVPLSFPGPSPKPKIIQSVTIEHMRLSEAGGKMLASGTVIAEISLPEGMESVDLVIDAVKPDILVFDGPPPEDGEDVADDEEEYPARAFGHIQPEEYLHATSERYGNPEHPAWITVRAPMEDVPVEILPGRDGVMRGFVSKVVFKGGAVAGIKGDANVKVRVKGVDGEVGLGGLPVKGEVWVGRQRSRLPWALLEDI